MIYLRQAKIAVMIAHTNANDVFELRFAQILFNS